MDNNLRIVTQIPLKNLWKEKENILAERKEYLTFENIKELLKKCKVQFVVADLGHKLVWIKYDKSFEFWKNDLKVHLANDINHIDLEYFPENYAYIASRWTSEIINPIILLEKYH